MKNRIFRMLLLSVLVALPAFAQQVSSSSSGQSTAPADLSAPAPQSAPVTGKEPQATGQGDFWEGDEPGLAWLVLHPFASKAYVRRHLQVVQDRVNELNELTASQARTIKDLDVHSKQGIQLASDKANEADQHATDAGTKAQTAQETANGTITRLGRVEGVVSNIDPYKATPQTEIRFRPGHSQLSEDAKRALDEIAAPLKDQHGYVIEVRGFSPGRGHASIAASRAMANSVVRYLVLKYEIPAYRIYVLSLGNAAAAGQDRTVGRPASRARVEISVLKNDLNQLASSSGTSTSPK